MLKDEDLFAPNFCRRYGKWNSTLRVGEDRVTVRMLLNEGHGHGHGHELNTLYSMGQAFRKSESKQINDSGRNTAVS